MNYFRDQYTSAMSLIHESWTRRKSRESRSTSQNVQQEYENETYIELKEFNLEKFQELNLISQVTIYNQ